MFGPIGLLTIASVLILAAIATPQSRANWPPWTRGLSSSCVFALMTVLMLQIVGSPLRPHFTATTSSLEFWQKILEAGWWLLGARFATSLVRAAVVLEHRPHETQIVSDLIAGLIYIGTALAIVNFAFSVPVGGLLATSGIIAIVLGLALQSTLADVFSGIAVGIERPYKSGDLICVEGGIEGQVLQVTWRSTHIATNEGNIATVPNSIIARARIINRSLPTIVRHDNVEIRLDGSVAPERCIEVLTSAMRSTYLPVQKSPRIVCTELNGDGNRFKVGFMVASSDLLEEARSEVLLAIHRHLRYDGIGSAVTGTSNAAQLTIPTVEQLLEKSDLFHIVEPSQRTLLATKFEELSLDPGETLIEQGQQPKALYLIASGVAEITVSDPDGSRLVHKLSPGETIGAIGLITNSNYATTATAVTTLKAYRLDRNAIASAMSSNPELAQGLEVLAKRGRATLLKDASAPEREKEEPPEFFLSRFRSFLQQILTSQ